MKRKVTRIGRCKEIKDRVSGKALFRVTGPCINTGKRVNVEIEGTRQEADAVVLECKDGKK